MSYLRSDIKVYEFQEWEKGFFIDFSQLFPQRNVLKKSYNYRWGVVQGNTPSHLYEQAKSLKKTQPILKTRNIHTIISKEVESAE